MSSSKVKPIAINPEKNVPVPKSKRATVGYSFSAEVSALEIGECCSRVKRIQADMTFDEFRELNSEMRNAFRNNLAHALKTAKQNLGHEYTMEITNAMTTPGYVYLVAIVTRVG